MVVVGTDRLIGTAVGCSGGVAVAAVVEVVVVVGVVVVG